MGRILCPQRVLTPGLRRVGLGLALARAASSTDFCALGAVNGSIARAIALGTGFSGFGVGGRWQADSSTVASRDVDRTRMRMAALVMGAGSVASSAGAAVSASHCIETQRARPGRLMTQQRWRLDGQTLITGASAGIGLAIAHELAGFGADLMIVGRDIDMLETARDELLDVYPQMQVHAAPMFPTTRTAARSWTVTTAMASYW